MEYEKQKLCQEYIGEGISSIETTTTITHTV